MRISYFHFFILLLLFITAKTKAIAGSPADTLLNNFITRHNTSQTTNSPEKLYLQLDRTTYAAGDTVWFRAYLFDATFLRKSNKSNIVYVELSDENNIVQVRRQVLMSYGLGNGCIPLVKRDFPDGGYTLRAYTNWQRNFDESGLFKKQFYVGRPGAGKWLMKMASATKDNTAQLHLQLLDMNKKPLTNQQVLLGVRQDESILRRDKLQKTDANGGIDLAVHIRDSKGPVYATLRKGGYDDINNTQYKFPVHYNRPEKTDVQFMPEGGNLVNGIPTIVGFKAIAEDGKGTDISGSIVNTLTNKEITTFTSIHKGMGSFQITPQPNASYKAIISINGTKKEYPLQQTKASGTVLNVINTSNKDSITIKVSGTADQSGRYMLLGQSRGMVCFAATVILNGTTRAINAPKSAFASGVTKFTLLNEQQQVLNERLIYNDNKDNLRIIVTPHQTSYTPQDSIALNIEVKDKDGNPVQGAFSMSVTNSIADVTNPDNPLLVSSTLLTSDLKGYVEQPNYYFEPNHEKELDNLLLTQGWTAYDWKEESKNFSYDSERDISISGKSTTLTNKPISGNNLQLVSLNPFFSTDTVSDNNGNFRFTHVLPSDSLMYIRAKNKRGRLTSTNIELDKREWPEFSANKLQTPWYFNTDTTRLKMNDTLLRREETNIPLTGNVLQEVTIRDKKIIKGSHNLNGPGEADQVIDEHDIAKEKPMTLLELLKKKVAGFRTTGMDILTRYFVNDKEIYSGSGSLLGDFVIDGIMARRTMSMREDYYNLLNSFTSDDIKGVELMSSKYYSKYLMEYLNPMELMLGGGYPPTYIEITTKRGVGPFFNKRPNYLLFKPIASAISKDFYRPRYTVKNVTAAAFDDRITIHWEPRIVTDKDGKATINFYAAGQPATYTVITEGSNMDGNVGSVIKSILVK